MNYTVRWLPPAEAKLRWFWARALVKEAVAEIADAVNRLLRDRPFDLGDRASGPTCACGFTARCASAS
jgi:hypothetical protein